MTADAESGNAPKVEGPVGTPSPATGGAAPVAPPEPEDLTANEPGDATAADGAESQADFDLASAAAIGQAVSASDREEVEAKDPRLGLILSGWRLDARIGVGRTATVYAASNQSGERAAAKVMNPAFKGDKRVRRRLFREANVARRAADPSVTIVHDNDVTPAGEPYLVMERLYGRDLNRLARLKGRPFEPIEALLVAAELLDLLVNLHARAIRHRNLTPFNVYITVDGMLKVFDFGSALVEEEIGSQTLSALASDPHGYLAPEIVGPEGGLGDERCDVYSLGAILFTMLSGVAIGDAPPPGGEPDVDLSLAAHRALSSAVPAVQSDSGAAGAVVEQEPSDAEAEADADDKGDDAGPTKKSVDPDEAPDSTGIAARMNMTGRVELADVILYSATPVSLAKYRADLDEDLIALVDGAFAADPDDRFPSALAFQEKVLECLAERAPDAVEDRDRRQELLRAVIGEFYNSAEELEKEETGAWRSAQVLRDIFRLVENTLYAAKRFGWDHEETNVRLEFLVENVLSAVADDPDGIFWVVRPYSFEYMRETAWAPEHPFDVLTYNLFDAGFRKMHLLPGLSEVECRDFLRWLTLDPEEDLAIEDDLATIFWQHEFDHVRCELVSAVVLQDVEDYNLLDNELKEMHAEAIEHLRRTIASKLSGAYEAVAELAEEDEDKAADFSVIARPTLLDMDAEVVRKMGGALERMIPLWRGRLGEILSTCLDDAIAAGDREMVERPLRRLIQGSISEGHIPDALEVYGAIAERIRDPMRRRQFLTPFTDTETFFRLLAWLVPYGDTTYYGDEIEFLATRLETLLVDVPHDMAPPVIEAMARCRDRTILAVLLAFAKNHARGFEEPLGELLRVVNPLLGRNIVHILRDHLSKETVGALEHAFQSPHAKVRIEAAEVLARYAPQRALRELRALLRDEDPRIRRRAVESVRANRVEPAVADLIHRIGERGFHGLPTAERLLVMRTACEVSDEDGERALVDLVGSHGLVANEELDDTRLLAVRILCDEAMTNEAYEVVRRASRKRWWNARALQEEAADAAKAIRARLDDLDNEIATRTTADVPVVEDTTDETP